MVKRTKRKLLLIFKNVETNIEENKDLIKIDWIKKIVDANIFSSTTS